MSTKKDRKTKNKKQSIEKKTIAQEIQLRLTRLDNKSTNISKQIDTLQKRVDSVSKLKLKIEKLKDELAKVKREKELELDEIALMCNTYATAKHEIIEKETTGKHIQETIAESAYAKLA
jgi:hypothetical protein